MNCDGYVQVVQQWPPLQRTVVPNEEEDEETSGINVEAAKERLRREDQEFDKMEYRRKIKEKHRVRLMSVPSYFSSSWFMPSPCSSSLKKMIQRSILIDYVQLQVL